MDAIIAIIWIVFMIIAADKTIVKKKRQQEEMQVRASAGEGTAAELKPVYTAPEEDIRSFLEEIGAKPATRPQPVRTQPQPVQAQPAQPSSPQRKQQLERSPWDEQMDTLVKASARRKVRSSSPAPAKAPKPASVWLEPEPDTSEVPEALAVDDPVAVLADRLSPIQRAVIWREILDTPPGLRAGTFSGEA